MKDHYIYWHLPGFSIFRDLNTTLIDIMQKYPDCFYDNYRVGSVYGTFPGYVEAMKNWNRVKNFDSYVFPGGTHDFPVWYRGFNDFIKIVFK